MKLIPLEKNFSSKFSERQNGLKKIKNYNFHKQLLTPTIRPRNKLTDYPAVVHR